MYHRNLTRTVTALVAAAGLFAVVSAGADAIPDTFNVSTTISASCSITDSGPANLFPQYVPSTDTSTGAATALNTYCNGSSPTVNFSDGSYGTTQFLMNNGGSSYLYYQISQNSSCNGSAFDNPIPQGFQQTLGVGVASFDICAAVITGGGLNTGAPAGTYTDTITYSISP
jgi:spore coat protein U-like protein